MENQSFVQSRIDWIEKLHKHYFEMEMLNKKEIYNVLALGKNAARMSSSGTGKMSFWLKCLIQVVMM